MPTKIAIGNIPFLGCFNAKHIVFHHSAQHIVCIQTTGHEVSGIVLLCLADWVNERENTKNHSQNRAKFLSYSNSHIHEYMIYYQHWLGEQYSQCCSGMLWQPEWQRYVQHIQWRTVRDIRSMAWLKPLEWSGNGDAHVLCFILMLF